MKFKELNLSQKLLSAIETAGYDEPTPIQAAAIPPGIEGKDVLGIAQTGTGKTASFVIPMLTRLERGRARARMPRSLILAPTRELAAQVAEALETLGDNHKLTIALLIGGVSFDEQFKKLDRGADILIATPGRLLDHFSRGKVLLTGVEILVIDEADRMLDMGFIDDIKKICGLLPPRRQTMFFSATMPDEIQKFTQKFLKDPVKVEVARQSQTASTITQRFEFCSNDGREKRAAFRDAIKDMEIENAIIFCNRKRDVDIMYKSMKKHGYSVGALHGDMEQRERMKTLDGFRNNDITFLVASDVAARGLDIPNVGHVFNFDIPTQAEDYVHRIGRTGRAGREGYAATFVTPDDKKHIEAIIELCQIEPEWVGDEPGNEDYRSKRGRGRASNKSSSNGRTRKPRRNEEAKGENTTGTNSETQSEDENRQTQARKGRTRSQKNNTENGEKRNRDKAEARNQNSRDNKSGQKDQNKKRQSRGGQKRNKNEKVIGMGDHVPAFMKREVVKAKD
jgi:superfamily II DNA/RNA helicase